MQERPTSAQLRDDIDRGRTGDKSPGLDPAAAPLGTDEEAAGSPPSHQEVAAARREENRGLSSRANAPSPGITPAGGRESGLKVPIIAALAILLLLVAAIFFAVG